MNPLSLNGAKVLVIGASSFIGSHLVPVLGAHGAIIHTANRSAPTFPNLEFTHWPLDITDLPSVERIISHVRPDYIFNLSGYVQGERTLENVWPTFKTNLEGTVNLLTTIKKFPCKRLILSGSLDEHQPSNEIIRPVSPYAASKIAASSYARMFHDIYRTPVVIAQLFMVYGPNQKDHKKLVPYTILSILKGEAPVFSNGARKVDWVFISDVIDGLVRAASYGDIEGATVQFGTGKLVAVKEVVSNIFKLLEVKTAPRFGVLPDRKSETVIAASTNETKELIGWEARISLEEGLKETVEWYVKQFKDSMVYDEY